MYFASSAAIFNFFTNKIQKYVDFNILSDKNNDN